jgi:hypothetical protein
MQLMKNLVCLVVLANLVAGSVSWANPAGGNNLAALDDPPWPDMASGPSADPGSNTGLAWGDFDGDGDEDLYLVKDGPDGPNVLLVNDGSGTFSVCDVPLLGDSGKGLASSWGDFDNDGDLDLFLANQDGGNRVFRNDGAGGTCWLFSEVTSADLSLNLESVAAEWVDVDHDGNLEVYISNRDGANQLFSSDSGFLDQVPSELSFPGASQGVAWCDYDLDMDPDLWLVSESDEDFLYTQNNASGFGEQIWTSVISGQGCSWGDFDNDGDFDLFVTYWGQDDILWENLGSGQFQPVANSGLDLLGFGQAAAWGDYDNDGFLDLFVANSFGTNWLFKNLGGSGQFSSVIDITGLAVDRSIGAAWSDVDLDGDLDLYICNYQENNKLLRNDEPDNGNWLQVDARGFSGGTKSNRAALGAIIKVEAGGLTMWRSVSGSTGYGSQGSLVQHFGLGDATIVDQVTVFWPFDLGNGAHSPSTITGVAINQRLLVEEQDNQLSGVPGADSTRSFTLGDCFPNPFNPRTTIEFSLERAAIVDLRVYDVSGNLIKVLVAGSSLSAGDHRVDWTGRDQSGNRVSAGVYLYRFASGGMEEIRRVVMVK